MAEGRRNLSDVSPIHAQTNAQCSRVASTGIQVDEIALNDARAVLPWNDFRIQISEWRVRSGAFSSDS